MRQRVSRGVGDSSATSVPRRSRATVTAVVSALLAGGIATSVVVAQIGGGEIDRGATVSAPARRGESVQLTEPPVPSFEGPCQQYHGLLVTLAPPGGWDLRKMARTMWRESQCRPSARSSTRDSGLLQINDVNHRYLRGVLGEPITAVTLFDPVQNVRAAAALCSYWRTAGGSCYTPWYGGA